MKWMLQKCFGKFNQYEYITNLFVMIWWKIFLMYWNKIFDKAPSLSYFTGVAEGWCTLYLKIIRPVENPSIWFHITEASVCTLLLPSFVFILNTRLWTSQQHYHGISSFCFTCVLNLQLVLSWHLLISPFTMNAFW